MSNIRKLIQRAGMALTQWMIHDLAGAMHRLGDAPQLRVRIPDDLDHRAANA